MVWCTEETASYLAQHLFQVYTATMVGNKEPARKVILTYSTNRTATKVGSWRINSPLQKNQVICLHFMQPLVHSVCQRFSISNKLLCRYNSIDTIIKTIIVIMILTSIEQ